MKLTRKAINREVVLTGILILIFIIGVIYFIFHNTNVDDFVKKNFSSQETNKNNEDTTPQDTTETSTSTTTSAGGGSVGGGGSSSGSAGGLSEETDSGITLPEDINNQPCGFYSGEFGEEACGGYCEVGTCIVEGRSCYCKE